MVRPSNDAYYISLLAGVAARSTCLRRQVGAIITDKQSRVLAMGFNGVPRGFPHCGERRRKIDVSNHNEPNAFILGRLEVTPVDCQGADDPPGDTRRCMAVHAEINALLTCHGNEHTMYVSCTPCKTCALAIANTNIKRVVCLEKYADDASHILVAAGILLGIHVEKDKRCADCGCPPHEGVCPECGHHHSALESYCDNCGEPYDRPNPRCAGHGG